MKVGIVIVNYKTAGLVVDCLRSLVEEVRALGDCRVVVVDNNSQDGSADKLRAAIAAEHWEGWAEVLPLDRNPGFAGGNNAGLRPLLKASPPPDALLLLNPDTVVRPGGVQRLVEFLEQHPEVGIAGSRLEDPDGTPQRSAFRFPTVWSELENGVRLGPVSKLLDRWIVAPPVRTEAHPADWVSGASMLVRRAVVEAAGLMDEGYFLYFEELDYCLAARRAGWPSWYVPASRIVHLVGQSTGVSNIKKRVPRYWFESRRRYFRKNYGAVYKFLADVAWAGGFALWRVRRLLQRKPDTDPPSLLWDFIRFNLLPAPGGSQ